MNGSTDDPHQGDSSSGHSARDRTMRLNSALESAGMAPLEQELADRFFAYVSLFIRWNRRINLSAIRDEEGIISRHLIESIVCAKALPLGIATLLDFGSGGGFPGIPIALCRPEISVTLAESQGKKAAFLQEAVRILGVSAKVHGRRAEELPTVFDCLVLRAVDRMPEAVKVAARLVRNGGLLSLMTTNSEAIGLRTAAESSSGSTFAWNHPIPLPGSSERIILIGQKIAGALGLDSAASN